MSSYKVENGILKGTDIETKKSGEYWLEIEIIPKDRKWKTIDDILLILHECLVSGNPALESWHFFREPSLRFRMEFTNEGWRAKFVDIYTDTLKEFSELVDDWYFANHGNKVKDYAEGYQGEAMKYKGMWECQKHLWRWGSEMAVAAIKEYKKNGKNEPSREWQLERTYHLLYNQMNPPHFSESELHQRCAMNRLKIYAKLLTERQSYKPAGYY